MLQWGVEQFGEAQNWDDDFSLFYFFNAEMDHFYDPWISNVLIKL